MRLIGWAWAIVAVVFGAGAAGQGTRPTETVDSGELRAEIKMLRATVGRLNRENSQLRARIAAGISDAEEGAGVSAATTRPRGAARKIQKVLFIVGPSFTSPRLMFRPSTTELSRALDDLRPDQSFNILVHGSSGVVAMRKGSFLPATDENRRRAAEFLKTAPYGSEQLEDALRLGVNYRPDSIWISTGAVVKDEEATLRAVREANAAVGIPINSVLQSGHLTSAQKHFLWQLARDSDGVCLNADGSPADEPVVPAVVSEPVLPAPATRPSVFRVR